MKTPTARYGFLMIIGLAVLVTAIVSSIFGAGYIMVVWLGWQIQASASLLVITFLVLVMLLAYALTWGRHYKLKKSIRLRQCPENVSSLNWFEQLGCYWLLDAKQTKLDQIQQIFNHSSLLKHLIEARLMRESGDIARARLALSKTPAPIQQLADLESIKLLLLEQQYEQAIQQLNVLDGQAVSGFIQSLQPAYQDQIHLLWKNLIAQVPWVVLSHQIDIECINHADVLAILSTQIAQATDAQKLHLLSLYDGWQNTQPLISMQLGKGWLALLQALPDTQTRIEKLSEQLLSLQFEPVLFDGWLQNQLQQGKISEESTQQRIKDFADKYPAQPSIAYAQWHVFQVTGQFEAASDLLASWPHDIRFCYLRLKQSLVDQPQRLADLDTLYHGVKH